MQARAARLPSSSEASYLVARVREGLGFAGIAAALTAAAAWSVVHPTAPRVALAIALVVALVGLSSLSWRASLYLLILWLAALGLVRRIATEGLGPTELDPLLLISPLLIGLLTLKAAKEGAFDDLTPLGHTVLVLSGLAVLGAINPLQGGTLAGAGGLIFVLVPLSAFWIGRALCDDETLTRVLKLVGVVAVPCALYGVLQVFFGFPSWDARWIRESGYTALYVFTGDGEASAIRPFSTFSSAAEFGYIMAIGFMTWLVFWWRGPTSVFAIVSLLLFVIAIALESSRGIFVVLLLGLAVMYGARQRLSGVLTAAVAGLTLITLSLAVSFVPLVGVKGEASTLVGHQVAGLSNPLDAKSSTLVVHLAIVRDGIARSVENPLGVGLSAITLAGEKLGGEIQAGTEADISNMAVALGIPGLIVYALLTILAFRTAYAVALRRRDSLGLLGLGILTATAMQWLNGGQYAVALLPWLILGWMDRQKSPVERSTGASLVGAE